MSFLSELKRRNVIRAGVHYLIVTWFVLQSLEVGTSLLELPAWTVPLVLTLLALGLPVALVLSWVFELTPEGFKLESEVADGASITTRTGRKLDVAAATFFVLTLVVIAVDRSLPDAAEQAPEAGRAAAPRLSIAVLPFVNMSSDEENRYFSDGLTEELLNLLAKTPPLQVAARTSAFAFRDSDADIREIARRLNVAHVLEGSVRKSGSAIRVTAQLIDARDGYHVWSETWDRELTDIFAIQDEISAAVVDVLRVELLGEAPRAYATDLRAFELWLEARAEAGRFTRAGLEAAEELATRALAIDPGYADAWYGLSVIYSNMVSQDVMSPASGFEQARAAAARALEIDPGHAKALSSLGWIALYWERDTARAASYMQRALALAPHDPRVLNALATLHSAFGQADEAVEFYGRALAADPLSTPVLANLAQQLMDMDRFDAAAGFIERIEAVQPESYMLTRSRAWMDLSSGRYDAAVTKFEALPGLVGTWGLALAHHGRGDAEASDEALAQLQSMASSGVAVASVHAHRGEIDLAFQSLDQAIRSGSDAAMEIRSIRFLSNAHDDPRWELLLAQLGLSDDDARRIGL